MSRLVRGLITIGASTLAACGGDDITATDAQGTAIITVVASGDGSGRVTSGPAGIECGEDCAEEVGAGATITLIAVADDGSTFMGWTGGGCSGTDPCTVTVDGNVEVEAAFAADGTLSVVLAGDGDGIVTASPGGIACSPQVSDCSEAYDLGTVVTLVATPGLGSIFTGWSGECSGATACEVTVDQARAVTANFGLDSHTLTVEAAGAGAVTSAPAGIDCGVDCSESYLHGTQVALTPAPAAGSHFVAWSGACSGNGACVVTLGADTTVTASFGVDGESLTVVKAGNGDGSVTADVGGIDCGDDCGEVYLNGTDVTLTAIAAEGSVFTGWSGSCTGTDPCEVSIVDATTVTATFTLITYTVSVSTDGGGAGTVYSIPTSVECPGAECSPEIDHGTEVTLVAAPASGSIFTGWSGACSGTGLCELTITGASSVNATFEPIQHTLIVKKTGGGSGTVSSPAGISCGTDCDEVVDHGATVTLTAAADPDSFFTGFTGGGCSTSPCTVSVTAATTVTATFGACTGSQTFDYTGEMQSFTVPACATMVTVDAYGAEGGTSTGQSGGLTILGGRGARAQGTFVVSGGEVLDIQVGGRGSDSNCGSGGGGGSFVTRSGSILLIAGGGGGGFHCNVLGSAAGGSGLTGTSGGDGISTNHPDYNRPPAPGGTDGNGGFSAFGGGGGGFLSAGTSQYQPSNGGGVYPGDGGTPGGGYGGGGGYYFGCCGGSGGGGGYSGGSGGQSDGCAGGGGGSINNGTAQIMTADSRLGDGVVTVSW